MRELEVMLHVYQQLISKIAQDGIPVAMRAKSIVDTVQDDPFDSWIEGEISHALADNFEIFHSGSLTTPDLVIRDKNNGTIVGIEIKKLIQKPNGSDSRGLTIDYNSCLPCGSALIKVGQETIVVPCFYLFALLDNSSKNIVTLIILDGDFLNYDFEMHKESKYANFTEYQHGPYEEGSVRHRKMYTYPNPLNSKIDSFHLRHIIIAKKIAFEMLNEDKNITEQIIRKDRFNNSFYYYLRDETGSECNDTLTTLENIFDACKKRKPKKRTASVPTIPEMTN